jgi:hypothetical protein
MKKEKEEQKQVTPTVLEIIVAVKGTENKKLRLNNVSYNSFLSAKEPHSKCPFVCYIHKTEAHSM